MLTEPGGSRLCDRLHCTVATALTDKTADRAHTKTLSIV